MTASIVVIAVAVAVLGGIYLGDWLEERAERKATPKDDWLHWCDVGYMDGIKGKPADPPTGSTVNEAAYMIGWSAVQARMRDRRPPS